MRRLEMEKGEKQEKQLSGPWTECRVAIAGLPLFGRKEDYQSMVKQRTGKLRKFIFLEHRAHTIR